MFDFKAEFQKFINSVMRALGFEDLPEPKKTEIIQIIEKRTDQKITITLFSDLDKKMIAELDKNLSDDPKIEEVVSFLSSKIHNIDEKISQAFGDLYDELVTDTLAIAKKAREKMEASSINNSSDKSGNNN